MCSHAFENASQLVSNATSFFLCFYFSLFSLPIAFLLLFSSPYQQHLTVPSLFFSLQSKNSEWFWHTISLLLELY
jgi:hypothetical protein